MEYRSLNRNNVCSDIQCNPSTSSAQSSKVYCKDSIPFPNRRKRRATLDDQDLEENPAKRAQLSCSTHSQSQPQPHSYSYMQAQNQNQSHGQTNLSLPVLITSSPSSSKHNDASSETLSSSGCLPGEIYEWSSPTNSETVSSPSEIYKTSYGEIHYMKNKNCSDWLESPNVPEESCMMPVMDLRLCPLPALSWANSTEVWEQMCIKDERAAKERNSSMLDNHPELQPRMRAILLDWLIEVCEVYKLHRETYYLAFDYIDRYLTAKKKVQKTNLQLIGITCLFIAAKVEEIYPPKIGEFAYVTDGACQEEDILKQELLVLSTLGWNISPVTILAWLGVYMQVNVTNRSVPSLLAKNQNSEVNGECHSVKFSKDNNNSCLGSNLLKRNINDNKNHTLSSNSKNVSCSESNVKNNNRDNNRSSNDEKNLCQNDVRVETNSRKRRAIFDHYTKSKRLSLEGNINNDDSCEESCSESSQDSINPVDVTLVKEEEEIAEEFCDTFIYPQFSGMEFAHTAQLIDLCSLDESIANYSYSVIAAAAISHTFNREIAVRVSGFDWDVIEPCAKWMEPFFQVICDEAPHLVLLEQNETVQSKYGLGHICPNIVVDDSHIIQTHSTSMDMFDKVTLKRIQIKSKISLIQQEASPAVTVACPDGLLTPPASNRKPFDSADVANHHQIIHDNREVTTTATTTTLLTQRQYDGSMRSHSDYGSLTSSLTIPLSVLFLSD